MKRVFITGVTKGLGRAMVDWFAGHDCVVFGCARSNSGIDELRGRHPLHTFHVVDVSDDRAVKHWADEILNSGEVPDILINNAATIAPNAPLWKLPAEVVDPVVRVNVSGTINVIRHFVPAMIKRESGVIVNFSSGWGRSAAAEVATYCATKWAVEGLTQALAQELPRGVGVVSLNPGIIDTEMLRMCFGDNAGDYPAPTEWARSACPFILKISAAQNGQVLTAPAVSSDHVI